jgi:hypothetical protein
VVKSSFRSSTRHAPAPLVLKNKQHHRLCIYFQYFKLDTVTAKRPWRIPLKFKRKVVLFDWIHYLPMDKVQFWMKPEYIQRLSKRAARYGLKPNEFARQHVMDLLDDVDRARVDNEIASLQAQLIEVSSLKAEVQQLQTQVSDQGKFLVSLDGDVLALKQREGKDTG